VPYGVSKPITLVHAFRLAEALHTRVILANTPLANDGFLLPTAAAIIADAFPRWSRVPYSILERGRSVIDALRAEGHRPVAIEITTDAIPYYRFRPQPADKLALIVGSEDKGLDDEVLASVADHLFIPMVGDATCLSAPMALAMVAAHFAFVEPALQRQ